MPATKKNHPSSPSHTMTQENNKLEAIKKRVESKFSQIEERITSIEQQIKSRNVTLSI